jgi:hypothetical protein
MRASTGMRRTTACVDTPVACGGAGATVPCGGRREGTVVVCGASEAGLAARIIDGTGAGVRPGLSGAVVFFFKSCSSLLPKAKVGGFY